MDNFPLGKDNDPSKRCSIGLKPVLESLTYPFARGDRVGIKIHWGERGNKNYLPARYTKEIVDFMREMSWRPFVFDTTVLYSGGRKTAQDALQTAAMHGFTEDYLGCPVIIGDGPDGRDVIDLYAGFNHFEKVQVASLTESADGFFIFSHFKGHLGSGFGGAIKNISMGFASRAQKQRMHADVFPQLKKARCIRCGICVDVCPTGAASISGDDYPAFSEDLCIGCAQCIALCPETAIRIQWESDAVLFQEKLVETGAAVWNSIKERTVLTNALINIVADCDCMPGDHEVLSPDRGFLGGTHPVSIDGESLSVIGPDIFSRCHPGVPWEKQFTYAESIGFGPSAARK